MRYVLMVLLAGCTVNDDPIDAGADSGFRSYSCTTACDRLAELNCPAGESAENGTSCHDVCIELETILPAKFHTKCVTRSNSCEAADACFE